MRLAPLVPHLAGLRLGQIISTDDHLTLVVAGAGRRARCPCCRRRARRVHSHYHRTVADVPAGHRPLVLRLRVRRFHCRNRACPRRIFAERFPGLVADRARRTEDQRHLLAEIALALGGTPGAALAATLGMPASRNTLLRLLQALPGAAASPRVVGVDDFAFRRGLRYGTLVVDLERRRPIAVLPDRSAATVARCLAGYPRLEVVVRDRYDAYAAAVAAGAPQAVQVVDRFHLLINLGEAVEDFLFTKTAVLRQVRRDDGPAPAPPASPEAPPEGVPPWRQRLEEVGRQRHLRRVEHHRRIHELSERGAYIKDIAEAVGVGRRTVYRYLHMPEPPPAKRPTRRARQPMLAPYRDYLLKRWDEGCRNATRLWREIRAMGYPGTVSPVSKLVARWRRDQAAGRRPDPLPPAAGHLTVRQAALLFQRRPDRLKPGHRGLLDRLFALDAALATAYRLAQGFGQLVRERAGERLDAWIGEAEGAGVRQLRRFALGLQGDPAVRAGLTEVWSNGQTEGQVGRLKLLKRAAYGRAGLPLLRARLLRAG